MVVVGRARMCVLGVGEGAGGWMAWNGLPNVPVCASVRVLMCAFVPPRAQVGSTYTMTISCARTGFSQATKVPGEHGGKVRGRGLEFSKGRFYFPPWPWLSLAVVAHGVCRPVGRFPL